MSNNSVIGSVTAASRGTAYIVPFADLKAKVRHHFGTHTQISMPLPFVTFMEILYAHSPDTRPWKDYLDNAISEKSLQASAGDIVARYFLRSIKGGKATEIGKLMEGMKFDYAALRMLFEDLETESTGIADNKKEMVTLARAIIGDRDAPDKKTQVPDRTQAPSNPSEAESAVSTTRQIHGKVARMISRGRRSKEHSRPGSSMGPQSIAGTQSPVPGGDQLLSNPWLSRSTVRSGDSSKRAAPLPLGQRKYHVRAFTNVAPHQSAIPLPVHTMTRSGSHGSGYYPRISISKLGEYLQERNEFWTKSDKGKD